MWQTRTFKTRAAMLAWIERMDCRVQWHEIFVNNAYGVQYRKLRTIM